MFNQITWKEFAGFAIAIAVVAFLVGWATRSFDYPTTQDEAAREAVAVPSVAEPGQAESGDADAPPRRPVMMRDLARKKLDPAVVRRADPKALEKKDAPQPPAAAPAAAPAEKPAPVIDYGALQPSPAIGPDEPLVSVVICTDFQCPVCSRSAREMQPIIEQYKDRVRFEVKNNALEMHRNAERAAIAGLAAHRQGKFWHMHDEMFRQQRFLTDDGLLAIARSNGLNVEQFADDIADPKVKAQVQAETALCAALGSRGTPTYFINGELNVGWGSAFGFEAIIKKHLGYAEEEMASGTPKSKLIETLVKKYATEPAKYYAMMIRNVAPEPMK